MTGDGGRCCPLCGAAETLEFSRWRERLYHSCTVCELVWLHPAQRPSRETELAEYRLHNNDPADPRYRHHLAKLTDQLVACLPAGAAGLDFGSGPGPAINPMLAEQGFYVTNYDPFFAPDIAALEQDYDFITCTEAAEHFHDPAREFALLASLIRPGGYIGIMTRLRTSDINFANWYYIREQSHVTFYAAGTMQWIAAQYGWRAAITRPDVTIFSC